MSEKLSHGKKLAPRLGSLRSKARALIASCLISCAPAAQQIEAETPEQAKLKQYDLVTYPERRTAFFMELNPACAAEQSPLKDMLREPPFLYHSNNLAPVLDENTMTPSVVYNLAREARKEAARSHALVRVRKEVLGELEKAASPGVEEQDLLQDIYQDNTAANNELSFHLPEFESQLMAVEAEVKRLVNLEAVAAQAFNVCQTAETLPFVEDNLVPLKEKSAKAQSYHSFKFDDYPEVEPYLSPPAFRCDDVAGADALKPSSIAYVESVRALKEYAVWHREAAVQRKEAYHALRAYIIRNPQQINFLQYDGGDINDLILEGWHRLVREEPDSQGQRGPLVELLEKAVKIAEIERRAGEKIGRCSNEYGLVPNLYSGTAPTPGGTPNVPQTNVPPVLPPPVTPGPSTGPQPPTPPPTPPANPTPAPGAETTGDFYTFQTDASVAEQLERLDAALNQADISTLRTMGTALASGTQYEAQFNQLIDDYANAPDDLRRMMAKQNMVSPLKFLLSLQRNRGQIPAIASQLGVDLNAPQPQPGQGANQPQSGPEDQEPLPQGWTREEYKVLIETNRVRAAGAVCRGVPMPPAPPVQPDERLMRAARSHSGDMASRNYFSHDTPEGVTPADRMRSAGFTGPLISENIAGGRSTAEGTVIQWLHSTTGHCENLMDPDLTHLGVGHAYDPGSRLRHYWTQNFGAE